MDTGNDPIHELIQVVREVEESRHILIRGGRSVLRSAGFLWQETCAGKAKSPPVVDIP